MGGELGTALGPVRPSIAFRQRLSSNLELAARRKATGEPLIEDVTLMQRTAIMVAGIIGVIAALVAVIVYHWEGRRRESRSSTAA
jgi:hypothetical protein